MLVDDSIIVAEQYFQRLEQGMPPKKAAATAAMETLGPVTATILTTMVAFGSLFFMEGIMGKFLWAVPAVVIIALAASWLECFTILPAHLADFAGKIKNPEKQKWYEPLLRLYEKSLRLALRFSKMTVVLFIVMFFASVAAVKFMRFELFPADDVTWVVLNVKGPVGTPFEVVNQKLTQVEKVIEDTVQKGELVGYRTTTGYQTLKGGRSKSGSHYGNITMEFTMQDERERSTDEILKNISDEIKPVLSNFEYSLERMKNGPPTGKPVNIEFYGEDLDQLLQVSLKMKEILQGMEGILSAELDYEVGKKQIIVDIDEQNARRLGVSNTQVARELRGAFEGFAATTVKKSDEDMDIWVRLSEDARKVESTLERLSVANAQGRRIPLNRLATFREDEGAYVIRRFNRKRTFAVMGEVDLEKTTSKEVNEKLKTVVSELLNNYPDITFALMGENKDTQDSLESFKKALVASSFIIFIMLVVQFKSLVQPILVMSAIPFALIGVVISFLILKLPIGFMALMGMLGLVGVVINDSIVLVTFINRHVHDTGFNLDSLVKATLSRFRPVILTTFTTVAGLLPVVHAPGGDPFLKPMATSFAYGLLFSSSLTLIFIPCTYYIYMKVIKRFNKEPELG